MKTWVKRPRDLLLLLVLLSYRSHSASKGKSVGRPPKTASYRPTNSFLSNTSKLTAAQSGWVPALDTYSYFRGVFLPIHVFTGLQGLLYGVHVILCRFPLLGCLLHVFTYLPAGVSLPSRLSKPSFAFRNIRTPTTPYVTHCVVFY